MHSKDNGHGNRAAIYTRVSSDKQEIDGTSLDTQLASCRTYCAEHGYQITGEFTDTHTGAQYRERPGLSKLRDVLRAGGMDVVVCHALDRLSRDQTHTAVLVDEIEHHGGRLELITESFEDSAVGKFIRSAKSFASEVEREKLTERVSRGRRARALSGKYLPGKKAPYGYRISGDRARLVIHEDEAPVVRRIFRDYVAGGTLRGIAIALREAGIPSPSGNVVWQPSTLKFILENETYRGRVFSHGDILLPEGTAPELVDEATFAAAQRRLATNRQRAKRNAKYPDDVSLLRGGFIICGLCGASVHVRHTDGPSRYYSYTCSAADRAATCRRYSMRTHKLDTAVWDGLRAFMLDDDVLDQTKDSRGRLADPGPELELIERSLAGIGRQRDNLARSIATTDDPDTAEVLVAQLEQLSRRRRALEAELEAVAGQVESYQVSRQVLDDLNGWRKRTAAAMDCMNHTERRMLLDQLRIKVQLWPTDHDPRWLATSEIVPSIVLSSV